MANQYGIGPNIPNVSVHQAMRSVARKIYSTYWEWYVLFLRSASGVSAIDRLLLRTSQRAVRFILATMRTSIGIDNDIQPPLIIHNAGSDYSHLSIGSYCHIGKDVFLDLAAPITIEDRVTVAMRATIVTHMDVGKSPLRDVHYPNHGGPVHVSAGAYVGACALILPGVTIGVCAVVAAGAVVTHDVAPYTVVAGVPATVLKQLDSTC